MKNRVQSGSVTGTDGAPPAMISFHVGTTEPVDAQTFPYLQTAKSGPFQPRVLLAFRNNDSPNVLRGLDHVGGSVDVGFLDLDRVVGADLDALERRGMNDGLNAVHGAVQAVAVADIADEHAKRAELIERG